jgi:excinuclease ABC subunit A
MDHKRNLSTNVIKVRGARENNLKNIDVDIPKDSLVVITGLSGSGKSSLAFDTIYAEGQRRYVESLSSYARQFLGLMEKPDVDLIEGLAPAISIDQKSAGHNPRSTVGTVTEIYDYLRLLFARIGHPRSHVNGERLVKQSVQQIVDDILSYPLKQNSERVKIQILSPLIKNRKGTYEELFNRLLAQGYVRVRIDGKVYSLEEEIRLDKFQKHNIELIVDSLVIDTQKKSEEDSSSFIKRLTDSVELALNMGEQEMYVNIVDNDEDKFYSEKLVDPTTGEAFPEIEPHSFSFNSPFGACPKCSGLGIIKEIDPSNIYNPRLTLAEGGIYPWARMADNMDSWQMQVLTQVASQEGFSMRTPIGELSSDHLDLILYGSNGKKYDLRYKGPDGREMELKREFEGVIPNLTRRYQQTDSEYIRGEIEEYMNELPCPECKGARLKKESLAVTIAGLNILDITNISIKEAQEWINTLAKNEIPNLNVDSTLETMLGHGHIQPKDDLPSLTELEIARQIFKEISARLNFLVSVGLNYLTLSRKANTLSGGEAQRIRLASQIGTGLTGVLYVLDEPSIGLHQRDNDKLLGTLREL